MVAPERPDHAARGSDSVPNHWDAVTALFADNLRRFDSGQPLLNVVDKREGY